MNIPPGYMLTVTSYEGDFDRYEKVVVTGLSKVDLQFYLALLVPFQSESGGKGLYGGVSVSSNPKAPLYCLMDAFTAFPPSDPVFYQECFDAVVNRNQEGNSSEEFAHDLIAGLIGTWNEGYNYRTFACSRVHYVAQECPDVTAEFNLANFPVDF